MRRFSSFSPISCESTKNNNFRSGSNTSNRSQTRLALPVGCKFRLAVLYPLRLCAVMDTPRAESMDRASSFSGKMKE